MTTKRRENCFHARLHDILITSSVSAQAAGEKRENSFLLPLIRRSYGKYFELLVFVAQSFSDGARVSRNLKKPFGAYLIDFISSPNSLRLFVQKIVPTTHPKKYQHQITYIGASPRREMRENTCCRASEGKKEKGRRKKFLQSSFTLPFLSGTKCGEKKKVPYGSKLCKHTPIFLKLAKWKQSRKGKNLFERFFMSLSKNFFLQNFFKSSTHFKFNVKDFTSIFTTFSISFCIWWEFILYSYEKRLDLWNEEVFSRHFIRVFRVKQIIFVCYKIHFITQFAAFYDSFFLLPFFSSTEIEKLFSFAAFPPKCLFIAHATKKHWKSLCKFCLFINLVRADFFEFH